VYSHIFNLPLTGEASIGSNQQKHVMVDKCIHSTWGTSNGSCKVAFKKCGHLGQVKTAKQKFGLVKLLI
jgi:hypothetical protein